MTANFIALDRRRALLLLAASGIALALPAVAGSACPSSLAKELDPEAVRELGKEYLTAHAGDAGLRDVAAILERDNGENKSAPEALRALMQADFEAGRVVNLSGWFVSLTEARLFAAFSACRPAPQTA